MGDDIEWPDKPIMVTDSNIDQVIEQYPALVVDCWAQWCPPCHIIAPVIEDLARDKKGKVAFGKLNVDDNRQTATIYSIMSIPTLLVFKDGELVDRIIGAAPRPMLEDKLKQSLPGI